MKERESLQCDFVVDVVGGSGGNLGYVKFWRVNLAGICQSH